MFSLSPLRAYYLSALSACAGAAAIFWKGRQAYRHLLFGHTPLTTIDMAIIALAVLAIQIAYWTVLSGKFPFVPKTRLVFATVLFFLSRISFMLAGALFSIAVLVRLEDLQISLVGAVLFISVLFSLFCFSRWLETVGNAFEAAPGSGTRPPSRAPDQDHLSEW